MSSAVRTREYRQFVLVMLTHDNSFHQGAAGQGSKRLKLMLWSLTPAVSGTSSWVSAGALTAMTVWSLRLPMERMS